MHQQQKQKTICLHHAKENEDPRQRQPKCATTSNYLFCIDNYFIMYNDLLGNNAVTKTWGGSICMSLITLSVRREMPDMVLPQNYV
jgi:hypothetical protein